MTDVQQLPSSDQAKSEVQRQLPSSEPAAPDQDLDEFLGVRTRPAWLRYGKWLALALAVAALGWVLWHFLSRGGGTTFATAAVGRGDLRRTVSATGRLAPTNQVTVGAQLSGQVIKVLVDVNDRVVANQPLAEIDPKVIEDEIRGNEAQLGANRASVGQARATLAESQAQLRRLQEVQKLSNGRVPSPAELQTAEADVQRAQASLNVAQANVLASQAQLGQSRTQRARATIRSPVSGVVLARQIDPGQTVASSFNTPTLFVIAEDLSKMKLTVSIDEADVAAVKEGQKATFTVDAFPGRTFPATISLVEIGSNLSAQSSSGSGTASTAPTANQVVSYAADLAVDNPSLQLRPGMTATADIVTSDKKDVLLVPNAALRFSPAQSGAKPSGGGITNALTPRLGGGGSRARTAIMGRGAAQTVYVLGDDGKPQAVRITTGDSDGSQTEVLSGDLQPGMKVITGELQTGGAQAR